MTGLVKYPRTAHLPWSPGASDDDLFIEDISIFEGKQIVVTEKMDGENTSIYQGAIHARSLDSGFHPSRTWVRGLAGQIRHEIPSGWRICGENLYAKHSIGYENLSSFFMVFSIWNEKNEALDWDTTEEWCELLGLKTVPVLYRGIWDETKVRACYDPTTQSNSREGYVVRIADSYAYADFQKSVAKFVRKDHITTTEHWMHSQMIPNRMANE